MPGNNGIKQLPLLEPIIPEEWEFESHWGKNDLRPFFEEIVGQERFGNTSEQG
jgi:hypothetical protein